MNATKRKPTTIDEYLENVPEAQRPDLEALRRLIKKVVPKAEEYISYGLAAFRLDGRPLVAFGGWANHCAFYPMSARTLAAFGAELDRFSLSKGTIRFTRDNPLPAAIVRELVKARIAENNLRTANAKGKKR